MNLKIHGRPRSSILRRCAVSFLSLSAMGLIPAWCLAEDPKLDTPAQQEAPTAFAAEKPKPVLHWGEGDGKSYAIPALDIFGFDFTLNQFNRHFIDSKTYGTNFSSFKNNL